MWDNRRSGRGRGQTLQFLVWLANLLLSRVENQLVVRGHPIKQRSQLSQDALLQGRRYNGPFRETEGKWSERNTEIGDEFSPINMEWITQDTSVDDFVISWLLAVCTPGSICIYPCYRF
jgi:hypothetical protein